MILLILLLLFVLFWAVVFVVTVALVFLFIVAVGIALLLCVGWREIDGNWPSTRAVTTIAGLSFTGFLLYVWPTSYVLIGGVIGTVLAARTANDT